MVFLAGLGRKWSVSMRPEAITLAEYDAIGGEVLEPPRRPSATWETIEKDGRTWSLVNFDVAKLFPGIWRYYVSLGVSQEKPCIAWNR